MEKFNVLQHPEYTEKLCAEFAAHFKDMGIETVVGPATGGIILSQVTARLLGVRSIFTERENGVMTFRRGFHLEPGEKVLIVEDVVTTGSSIKEVVNAVNQQQGDIVGVGLFVDRSGGTADFGVPAEKSIRCSTSPCRLTSRKNARSAKRVCRSPNGEAII